jgi:predicted MFS family arabinose efflux permease
MPAHDQTHGNRRWIELTAATLSQFGASVTQQGTIILGVFFAEVYSLTLPQMGAVVASLTLGLVVSGLYVGVLVDTYGPRRVLFAGTLLLTALAAAIGAIHTLPATVVLLFLLGVVLGVVPLSGTKAMLVTWPREQRGLPMGIRQMGVPAGALVASVALPALAAQVGVYPLYWGFAVLLAVCGLAFCAVLPPYAPNEQNATRVEGDGPRRLRHEAGKVVVPSLCGFLLAWGQYMLITYTIPMLHSDAHLSVPLAGLILAVAQVGGACGRILFGALSDWLGGRRDVVLMAAALGATLLACSLAALPRDVSVLVLLPLWLAMGVAMVGWNALMLTWAGERVSLGNAGAAMGLTTSAILFGATFSAPVFGLIVQASGTYRAAWLTLAAILCAAALLLWTQVRHESRGDAARRTRRSATIQGQQH